MKLNALFTDHAVLPANRPLRIYGEGCGEVTLTFAGDTYTVQPDQDGQWLAALPSHGYGGPYTLTASDAAGTVICTDIYVGEVYLLAGQSNAQFKLSESNTPASACADDAALRLFTLERLEPGEPHRPEDGWVVCTAADAGNWSAVGYLAGRELTRRGIAVGMIACYQGASVIESWLPAGMLEQNGISFPLEDKHIDHYYKDYSWNGDGVLYDYMLKKLIPYPLTAVIWYQGESDTKLPEAGVYLRELSLMIQCWRRDFMDDALPFVVIRIADYAPAGYPDGWRAVQQAQLDIAHILPNVQVVDSADVCETDAIHPPTRGPLSHRIAEALSR